MLQDLCLTSYFQQAPCLSTKEVVLILLKNIKAGLGFWSSTTKVPQQKKRKGLWKVHAMTTFHDHKTKREGIRSHHSDDLPN